MLGLNPFRKNINLEEGYTELNPERILDTLKKLHFRIGERFPESGLKKVCGEFQVLVEDCIILTRRLAQPLWPVRILAFIASGALICLTVSVFYMVYQKSVAGIDKLADAIQTLESGINETIFLSVALFFLVSLEIRVKRHFALKALHKLRSIAHVVDMHQLTKDPAYILHRPKPTKSSPERKLSRNDLIRYLDYCSEILSINSKTAALFVQNLHDPVILTAVDELDNLTQGLSSKIWQKIMILDLSER
jgi:hypothetical protein